jgi:TatD DNase family protein
MMTGRIDVTVRMLVADSAIKVVRYLPSDRILTETDAPFIEIAGRKAEPRDVATTREKLAELGAVSVAEMSETLHANAARVFAFAGLGRY